MAAKVYAITIRCRPRSRPANAATTPGDRETEAMTAPITARKPGSDHESASVPSFCSTVVAAVTLPAGAEKWAKSRTCCT